MSKFVINTKTVLSSVIASALLVGCAVGPNYEAPKLNLVPFHNTINNADKSKAAPPLEQWWVGFEDPILVSIVQRALTENLDIAASVARVNQAKAAAGRANALKLPTVDLGTTASWQHQSLNSALSKIASDSPGYDRNYRDLSVGPAASWELDIFGGLGRNAKAFSNEIEAAEADQAGSRIIVAADAADAYLQIRGYQARLVNAENQIEIEERLLKLVKRRHELGAAQGLEVAQAEALLKSAHATIPPLRIALEQQSNRLDVLMGVQPGTFADEIKAVRPIPQIPAITADTEPLNVLGRRPDVIAAERRLAASNERIGAAISNYYPKVSLFGLLGFSTVGASSLFTSRSAQALAGGTLRWRLFDFGKVDAEVGQAKGANAEALAIYRKSVLRAAEDVEDAIYGLSQTQVHVHRIQEQVTALAKARDLSEKAYKSGSINLTDVLLADQQLLTARDQLDAAKAAAARAAVGTFRALGGGWDQSNESTKVSQK